MNTFSKDFHYFPWSLFPCFSQTLDLSTIIPHSQGTGICVFWKCHGLLTLNWDPCSPSEHSPASQCQPLISSFLSPPSSGCCIDPSLSIRSYRIQSKLHPTEMLNTVKLSRFRFNPLNPKETTPISDPSL